MDIYDIPIVSWILKPVIKDLVIDENTKSESNYQLCDDNVVTDKELTLDEMFDDLDNVGRGKKSNKPLEVKLKGDSVNAEQIIEYKGEGLRKFEFRPRNFKEFIGQEEAKDQSRTIIKKIKKGMKGHFYISARQGMGKTAFTSLLANELNAKLINRIGRQLSETEALIEVVNEINTSEENVVMFYLDECDSMDTKMVKMLNPIIEQFELSGKKIKPFIFACTSINKDIWIKNNPDTLDRIGHHIQFHSYSDKDLINIIRQYKEQLYPEDKVTDEVYNILANSCKYCPRIGLSLLEDYVVEQDIEKVLKNRRIVKDGLTEVDVFVLETLEKAPRAMGANAVALKIGIPQNQYVMEFEPFLFEYGYINRVPSRILTQKGKKFLEEIRGK